MELREQFEKLHPMPEGVSWSDVLDMYACEFLAYQSAEKRQNGLWQGFQSGHAAGLEQQAKRITELEARLVDQTRSHNDLVIRKSDKITELSVQLADAIEAQQVLGLKLAHAEGHSAGDLVHYWSDEEETYSDPADYLDNCGIGVGETFELTKCYAERKTTKFRVIEDGDFEEIKESHSANTVGGPTPVMDAAP